MNRRSLVSAWPPGWLKRWYWGLMLIAIGWVIVGRLGAHFSSSVVGGNLPINVFEVFYGSLLMLISRKWIKFLGLLIVVFSLWRVQVNWQAHLSFDELALQHQQELLSK